MGIRQVRQLAREDMPDSLRTGLWNVAYRLLLEAYPDVVGSQRVRALIEAFEYLRLDRAVLAKRHGNDQIEILRNQYAALPWFKVYDLFEVLLALAPSRSLSREVETVLREEGASFRVLDDLFVPITNDAELASVADAVKGSRAAGLDGVLQCLEAALGHLGKRPDPEYKGAVQEAIHAVESLAMVVTGDPNGTLTGMLSLLAKKTEMHPQFKTALGNLYNWASDDGIRHGSIDGRDVTEAEARFIVITSSAFINYVVLQAKTLGLKLGQ
jgi:hypothetical protein